MSKSRVSGREALIITADEQTLSTRLENQIPMSISEFMWKNPIRTQNNVFLKGTSHHQQNKSVSKSTATMKDRHSIDNNDGSRSNAKLHEDSIFPNSHPFTQGSREIDEKEKLRRMRISKANKGNVPWNKGGRHSAGGLFYMDSAPYLFSETLQKIRERTRAAMQDPKVMRCQDEVGESGSCTETRISERDQTGLGLKGYGHDSELQWDTYSILNEQLKKEWLESVERRKMMPRLRGSRRVPKSPEQRRKISEAISAKWADQVCSALAKYHGIPEGEERKWRKKPSRPQSLDQGSAGKLALGTKSPDMESKSIREVVQRKKISSSSSFKDPRHQRAAMATKKRAATKRAIILIARAEKAARALEAAEPKSPLTRALLQEARELIAEARRSVESIESGPWATSHEAVDGASAIRRQVNGGLRLTNFMGQTPQLAGLPPEVEEGGSNGGMISSPFGDLEERLGVDPSVGKKGNGSISSLSKAKKRWVRGRLVDVEED
ncbi:unnamed protein product [Spirodela intermedia]|uniref:Uncharacterized protein n=1 Tax=Spirodela intermedia TaxID=51605 RepID=A0A7I8JBK0_SPIIN|nr:unnamed protein product [Spirodela intermedia]CAA6666842.1 unnamed protein product [Spirodela intermedia]